MLDFLGVRYILVHQPEDREVVEATGKYRLARTLGDVMIFENPQARPLAFFASQTADATNWNQPPEVVHAGGIPALAMERLEMIASIRFLRNGDVEVSGHSNGDGLVVLTTLGSPRAGAWP